MNLFQVEDERAFSVCAIAGDVLAQSLWYGVFQPGAPSHSHFLACLNQNIGSMFRGPVPLALTNGYGGPCGSPATREMMGVTISFGLFPQVNREESGTVQTAHVSLATSVHLLARRGSPTLAATASAATEVPNCENLGLWTCLRCRRRHPACECDPIILALNDAIIAVANNTAMTFANFLTMGNTLANREPVRLAILTEIAESAASALDSLFSVHATTERKVTVKDRVLAYRLLRDFVKLASKFEYINPPVRKEYVEEIAHVLGNLR